MSQTSVQDIRNIAFCGHGNAGKTSLADKILTSTGAVKRPASVDDGTSVCDFDDEEKHHKHSIESSLVHFSHAGKQFNLLDTPGYPDFIGQSLGALAAVETAAIVINAHDGLGVNTRRMFLEAGKLGLGRLIIVNKMDTENVDFPALGGHHSRSVGPRLRAAQRADRPRPRLSRRGQHAASWPPKPTARVVNPADRSWHADRVDHRSRRRGDGTLFRRDAADRRGDLAVDRRGGRPGERGADRLRFGQDRRRPARTARRAGAVLPAARPDRAARQERSRRRKSAIKRRPGRSAGGAGIQNPHRSVRAQAELHADLFRHAEEGRQRPRLGRAKNGQSCISCWRCKGAKPRRSTRPRPGEIVAVAKVEELHTGLSLGDLVLPAIQLPTPMVGLAVIAQEPWRRGQAFRRPAQDRRGGRHDPLASRFANQRAGDRRHERIAFADSFANGSSGATRSKSKPRNPRFPIAKRFRPRPREVIGTKSRSGGRGQFGEVHIRLFPMPTGVNPTEFCTKARFPHMREFHYDPASNFLWVDSIVGGTIPNNFLPAVEKGFQRAAGAGRDRRLSDAERRRRSVFWQTSSGRQLGSGVQNRRLDGVSQRIPAGQAGTVGADRHVARHRARGAKWATSTATCRAAAAGCWEWNRPAAICKPSPPTCRWPR